VYVDGILVTTLSLDAPSTMYRRVVFARSWTSSGTHTLRIAVVGTTGPHVDIDALEVIR
jgi:hypothetical protein